MEFTHTQLAFLDMVATVLTALAASGGFWAFYGRRKSEKGLSTKLLKGLAHDRIINLSLQYLEEGCVSHEAYENLREFLYKPYVELGGNGTVLRLMAEVDKLPILTGSLRERFDKKRR